MVTQATVLHPKLHFLNKSFLECFFFSGTSTEIQHDVSYKAKFMAAVRLWRKRDEEKRVWEMYFCIASIYLWKLCCEGIVLV